MQLPYFDQSEIKALANHSFSQNVADILNLFFGTRIDGWSVELGVGRYPVKTESLNSRITAVKTWHNPVCRFGGLVRGLEKVIRQSDQISNKPSDWFVIASRIAVLFGVYGMLLGNGSLQPKVQIDIAVPSGNLSQLMAAWYARKMGLPVGTIVCCCNENNGLWKLLHKGELRTDLPAQYTHTPDCDETVPADLERLIYGVLGTDEVQRFCEICRVGGTYYPEPENLALLREGIHVCVVSSRRMASTIPNLYKTTGFVSDPYTALAYSGLVDYRALTGESRQALIISEDSPLFWLEFVAQCMDMSAAQLKLLLN